VARMGGELCTWVLVGKPGRDLLEDLGVDGIIISKLSFSRIG